MNKDAEETKDILLLKCHSRVSSKLLTGWWAHSAQLEWKLLCLNLACMLMKWNVAQQKYIVHDYRTINCNIYRPRFWNSYRYWYRILEKTVMSDLHYICMRFFIFKKSFFTLKYNSQTHFDWKIVYGSGFLVTFCTRIHFGTFMF